MNDNQNQSPALAAMMATIVMPETYARIIAKTVANVNSVCPVTAVHKSN